MKGNYSITANFATTYALTISSTDGGSVTTPGEGAFSYAKGAVVSLVATTETSSSYEYIFVNWTSSDAAALAAIADVNSATTTITVNGNWSITANFVRWVARYDGGGEDKAYAMALDGDGNLYVTGSTYYGTDFHYLTVKYDKDLNQVVDELWPKRYSRASNYRDIPTAIAVSNGKVYVTGHSIQCIGSGIYTNSDYLTVSYDANGTELWAKIYESGGDDQATAIAVDDSSGNIYVTGASGNDYMTIKYNSGGVQQWAKTYDGSSNDDQATAIVVDDSSGNIYVTGCSDGGATLSDYATIKYNSGGVQQWVARYDGGGGIDAATAIAVDSSGNVYVTGYSYSPTTKDDYATVKYNGATGSEMWDFGGGEHAARYDAGNLLSETNRDDRATAITVDSTYVYVTGRSYSSATQDDYATVKYNGATGSEMWDFVGVQPRGGVEHAARYNGGTNLTDGAVAIAVDGSGNVYVTGSSIEGAASGGSYVTVKYNSAGVQQWARTYVGPAGKNDAAAMVIGSNGTVYVTGSSWGTTTDYDYATVMITQ
jgi:hypothetical protein